MWTAPGPFTLEKDPPGVCACAYVCVCICVCVCLFVRVRVEGIMCNTGVCNTGAWKTGACNTICQCLVSLPMFMFMSSVSRVLQCSVM